MTLTPRTQILRSRALSGRHIARTRSSTSTRPLSQFSPTRISESSTQHLTLPNVKMSSSTPSNPPPPSTPSTIPPPTNPTTTSSTLPSLSFLSITSTTIPTSAGISLTENQKLLVGSVLDLFLGKPTLAKLALWTEDAVFRDPLTESKGRKQFQAQWWGLKAGFSEIERLHVSVTDSNNPVVLDLKTRYKIKGLGTEKVIDSVVKIHTDSTGERITCVEDRWNGNIPEGALAKVFRNLNAVTVPVFVSVPKNEEEEAKSEKK